MDGLTLLGLLAVTAMLVFYALEDRSPWYVLAFAGACALASAYGLSAGRMAVRRGRGHMGRRGRSPLARKIKLIPSPRLTLP